MNNNNRGNNNHNSNNNRRRGRGNRPQGGGGGGGQQLNRIDSRARGNAPQLLEKYRKLAHDAHLNGDRVQAEYYLQYADHYFRVTTDGRQRQEEQRQRRDDRFEGGAEENDDSAEFSVESDFPSFDQPSYNRQQRDDRPRREERDDREERDERDERDDNAPRSDEAEPASVEPAAASQYEPQENPFVRDNRSRGGLKPRRDDRRPRRDERVANDEPVGLDPALLPPSISVAREEADSAEADAKPRKPRAPRRKPSADKGEGEALESVS